MRTFKLFLLSSLFMVLAQSGFAQETSEKIKVSGNCGMCKGKIEKAAKAAGATYALWDTETKELTVKYNSTSANSAKIQQSVAAAGYDTEKVKATNEAYNKLHGCCQYERTAAPATADCCQPDGTCKNADQGCCEDGKCTKSAKGTGSQMSSCSKEGHAAHAAKGEGAACCKKG
jgi:hypothetical protein